MCVFKYGGCNMGIINVSDMKTIEVHYFMKKLRAKGYEPQLDSINPSNYFIWW